MVEPMTAAEYRAAYTATLEAGRELHTRTLAALEERERLLAEESSNAARGALVRRYVEHPMNSQLRCDMAMNNGAPRMYTDETITTFYTRALAHLDSLLPKEPEVVTGKSGRQYRTDCGQLEVLYAGPGIGLRWERCDSLPVEDAPVVAKLMAKGGKDA